MSLYVGIDVGKFHHVACFLDDEGNQVDELKFTNTHKGFSELDRLINNSFSPDNGLILGMEATGHYWFPLYEFLTEKEYEVKVFNLFKWCFCPFFSILSVENTIVVFFILFLSIKTLLPSPLFGHLICGYKKQALTLIALNIIIS